MCVRTYNRTNTYAAIKFDRLLKIKKYQPRRVVAVVVVPIDLSAVVVRATVC